MSIRLAFGLKTIFLILLNDPLYIGFMDINHLLENNHLEDIFKLNGWDNSTPHPTNPTGYKQMLMQFYSYYIV